MITFSRHQVLESTEILRHRHIIREHRNMLRLGRSRSSGIVSATEIVNLGAVAFSANSSNVHCEGPICRIEGGIRHRSDELHQVCANLRDKIRLNIKRVLPCKGMARPR